ncbi:MAG TPA: hypothetical protein PKV75_01495 [Desulfobacterales bacterium]|nr:hypothetical protein [Desulfobacterales bacterium]
MDWFSILQEIICGVCKIMVLITAILLLLMIGLELIKEIKLLDRAAAVIQPLMRVLDLPKEGAYPMLAGIFLGITYGSGVILAFTNDGSLKKKDIILLCVFLAICHGMIEDTMIFAAIGAKWWVLVVIRVSFAFIIVKTVSILLKKRTLLNRS